MTKARQKGVRKVNEMKINARENKWGPLRVHRMNWEVRFRELTGWRPKNERRTVENLREITHGNVTEVLFAPKWAWLLFAPPFLLSTPPYLFLWFFFRNVTKIYEFRNDTCFLSVRLRNLTGHVITPFLAFGMLRKLTDCVTLLPFDFRHVTEFHRLRNNASFWFPACLGTSRFA